MKTLNDSVICYKKKYMPLGILRYFKCCGMRLLIDDAHFFYEIQVEINWYYVNSAFHVQTYNAWGNFEKNVL